MSLEWFPMDYNNYSQETPIVVYLLGSFGVSGDAYSLEFALKI